MDLAQDEEAFVRYLKLVVAVAVIRSCPSGLSGQQHAERLCRQYQLSQLAWKQKAKALEQELLLARQKAFHCQHTISVQRMSALDDTFPTPPSSAEAAAYAASDSESMPLVNFSDHKTILSKHTSFLQSILTLSSVSSRSVWDNAEITTHTVDAIKSSLELLTEFLMEEMKKESGLCGGLGSEVGLHSVTVISQFANVQTGSGGSVETVHRHVLKSARRFIDAIVDNKSLNKFAPKFHICQYILMLAKASVLREGILWLLLQQVVSCSEMLRLSINTNFIFEPQMMENIYYIFWCIEQLLCGDSVYGGELGEKFCCEVAFLLSESLLHISQNFPIFAYYIWHIGELVEGIKKK